MGRKLILSISFLFVVSSAVMGVPTLQVYSPSGVAGDWGPDQDTWYVQGSPVDLNVAVAFGSSIDEPVFHVGLIFSVPEGETGSISISGENIDTTLNNIYQTKSQIDAIYPQTLEPSLTALDLEALNNHYPLQDDVSDFLVLEIGNIYDQGEAISDYNADGGIIENTGATGDIMNFQFSKTGFTSVHIDAFGYSYNVVGQGKWIGSWELNPGSHDVTVNPAPGALIMAGLGIGLVSRLKKRRLI